MKIKTSELSGSNLDWAVAVAAGAHCQETGSCDLRTGKHWVISGLRAMRWDDWTPSTDWIQGGPLIERFRVNIHHHTNFDSCYAEMKHEGVFGAKMGGQTPLIAACRAIVAAKLGDEVDVPEGLV